MIVYRLEFRGDAREVYNVTSSIPIQTEEDALAAICGESPDITEVTGLELVEISEDDFAK